MFNAKDFVIYEDNRNSKRFHWCGLSVYCWQRSQEWSLCIESYNLDAENELQLYYSITPGLDCNSKTVASAMEAMFDNKYKDAYHKLIRGVLNGESTNDIFRLGVE